jgi:hypothetical protein
MDAVQSAGDLDDGQSHPDVVILAPRNDYGTELMLGQMGA